MIQKEINIACDEIAYDERIDQYLRGQMSENERAAFEQDVKVDDYLRERLRVTSLLIKGIQEEGAKRNQAQYDAVKSMSEEEFLKAIKPDTGIPKWVKWVASAAAAIALIIAVIPLLKPSFAPPSANMSELVALVEEYNQPLDNAPKEFESIRDQINNSNNKDALALVDNIQNLTDDLKSSIPVNPGVTKGVDDNSDESSSNASIKSETPVIVYDDYACWYKALAYLKAGEKDKAVEQLNILKENGSDRHLIEKANELLKKIDKLK